MKDAALGQLMLTLIGIFIVYYTFWVVVLPVLPLSDDNILYKIFPDITYALVTPVIIGSCFLGALIVFTVYHLQLSNNNTDKTVG